jgi:NAD(P)-dependent dehydrogenase (short-subunit alcohol dehydrogenase family)
MIPPSTGVPEAVTRVGLVTGGGTGIGAEVAISLAQAGYRVVIVGRRPAPLKQLASTLNEVDECVYPFCADVTVPSDVEGLFSEIESRFGRLDFLFNNAGRLGPTAPIESLSADEWNAVLHGNVTGSFLCARSAVGLMKRQEPKGGRIVNSGSLSAQVPRMNGAAYTAAKHAVTGLTRALALECRGHSIACGQIDVGNAATDMTAQLAAGVMQSSGTLAAEPSIDVRHVAEAVMYMASLPLDANVLFLTVMATEMPFVGRG